MYKTAMKISNRFKMTSREEARLLQASENGDLTVVRRILQSDTVNINCKAI